MKGNMTGLNSKLMVVFNDGSSDITRGDFSDTIPSNRRL